MQIGVVGKPNVGKTTFFSAATMAPAEIGAYPFTTIKPNRGVAFVRGRCPHLDFNVKCNPRNAGCEDGVRTVPVELLDVAGLVPDAWQGRGLGNQFLDDLRQADALIHVVDASGATDAEGSPVPAGSHDPAEDVAFLEREMSLWIRGILEKGWERSARQASMSGHGMEGVVHERLTGLGVTEAQTVAALRSAALPQDPMSWGPEELLKIAKAVRRISKPMVLALNKADAADDGALKRLAGLADGMAVPAMAEGELALRRAAKAGLVEYKPGDASFKADASKLNDGQRKALDRIAAQMPRLGGCGVQQCLELAAFKLLDLIIVYPVEDETRLTDHDGRVLPDAFLVPRGTTARQLAYRVHTDLGDNFVKAVNVRTKRAVGADHQLEENDVMTIMSRK